MAHENMHLDAAGYAALRFNEGVVMHYYNDAPINGNCTWGVGTLEHYGPCTPEELRRAVLPSAVDRLLEERVREAERIVRSAMGDQQLNQAQFNAAVSFAYNSTTRNTRQALQPAKRGNFAGTAAAMMQNVLVTPRDRNGNPVGPARVNPGLVNRRHRESAPFRRSIP